MNNRGNKVVLVSRSGYSPDKDHILQSLIDERIALFCAVGKDCEMWEEVMDELCVGDGGNPVFIPTTSHPEEMIDDVVQFAKTYRAIISSCGTCSALNLTLCQTK